MRKSYWLLGLLGVVLASCLWMPAFSGDEEDQPQRPPRGGNRMMPPMMGGGASICACAGDGVKQWLYVVRGNTIYKIDPDSLQVVKKATYEEEPKPPQGGQDNGPQGGGPQGGGRRGGPQGGPQGGGQDDGGK